MAADNDRQIALGASDRIELIATIVMAAAAILTAWAAFQSSKWSGVQAVEFSSGNAARIESTRLDTQAGQLTSIDVDVFLSWMDAIQDELSQGEEVVSEGEYVPIEGTLSAFYYERMRDEFKPALEAWLASGPLVNPDAPATPFATEEYVLEASLAANVKLDEAGAHTAAALEANQNSDNHVLVAVALALSIFFAGVSSKLEARRNRWITILLAAAIFLGAAATLSVLPKVAPF